MTDPLDIDALKVTFPSGQAVLHQEEFRALIAAAEERNALRAALDQAEEALIEAHAELIYLRQYGALGAKWDANDSKGVWRDKARAALTADAPTLAQAELRGKIEGMKMARKLVSNLKVKKYEGYHERTITEDALGYKCSILDALEARIADIQAEDPATTSPDPS